MTESSILARARQRSLGPDGVKRLSMAQQGALQATLAITGAKGGQVAIVQFDANARTATYQVDWQA